MDGVLAIITTTATMISDRVKHSGVVNCRRLGLGQMASQADEHFVLIDAGR
jgi:hypothetical protein